MKKAFTLAEVLITLGIIGVVAALVMPSLIANHQKKVWVAQLQKAVNAWDNGMALMLSSEEVDSLGQTQLARQIQKQFGLNYYQFNTKIDDSFINKYFKVSEIHYTYPTYPTMKGLNSPTFSLNNPGWYMPDGTRYYVMFDNLDNDVKNIYYGTVWIDINGLKGPNIAGRDVFFFYLRRDGQLLANGSEQAKEELTGYISWHDDPTLCGTPGSSVMPANTTGRGCAARIIENNWVMDY